jgi:hypothetical protein
MPKGTIDLHGIDREINAVARKLEAARAGAAAEDREALEALIRGIHDLQARARALCPKVYGVWPLDRPPKPRPPARPRPPRPKPASARRKPTRRK